MRKQSYLFILAVGLLAARAIAQEIVIEPTNGRAPTRHPLTRPAAVETIKPAGVASSETKSVTHPARDAHGRAVKATRKTAPATQIAEKSPASLAVPPPQPASAIARGNASEGVSAAEELPARPAWAMTDTRDARALQNEISNALARDPKLARSEIRIDVSDAEVTLAGRANGTEERLQAERLAQSYAWNRKLVDHIEVVTGISAQ